MKDKKTKDKKVKIENFQFSIFNFQLFCSLFIISSCADKEISAPLSPYLTQIFDYQYAAGQHAELASSADVQNIIGEPAATKFVYLGGWGGYIVAGFDHDVENCEGYDFEIYAFGVDIEPAVVYVMADENGNGKPDDTWHELKGNLLNESIRNYSVIYYKAKNDSSNIVWKDNFGNSGELISDYNFKCTAAWWWQETLADSAVFTGTRLPDAYENVSTEKAQFWRVKSDLFLWGYAENKGAENWNTTTQANRFDISNAIDEKGNAINLEKIRFLKIQTAVFQRAGWLNEVSAEIRGAKDLHL